MGEKVILHSCAVFSLAAFLCCIFTRLWLVKIQPHTCSIQPNWLLSHQIIYTYRLSERNLSGLWKEILISQKREASKLHSDLNCKAFLELVMHMKGMQLRWPKCGWSNPNLFTVTTVRHHIHNPSRYHWLNTLDHTVCWSSEVVGWPNR